MLDIITNAHSERKQQAELRTPAGRQSARDEIDRHVEAFLSTGGVIQGIESGWMSQGAITQDSLSGVIQYAKRVAKQINPDRLKDARKTLKRTPGLCVDVAAVVSITGLRERTVERWQFSHDAQRTAIKPVQTRPCRWRLRQVVEWCDSMLENNQKYLARASK